MTKPTAEEKCELVLAQLEERRGLVPVIDSPEAAQWAVNEAHACKTQREQLEALLAPGIAAAHEAHKKAIAARDRFTKPLHELERAYTCEVLAFQDAQRAATAAALTVATTPAEVATAVAILAPKPTGIQERNTPWKWECVDLLALVKAVAKGEAPLVFLTTADAQIGKVVRAMKDTFKQAGIRTWREKIGALV
jgi:hypothetical protein